MAHRPPKVLFIGLDAVDKDLVQQWVREGDLPVFRSLLAQGAWADTLNPPGHYVGAAWPTFSTGVSTPKHGRYCFQQIRPGSYDISSTHDIDYPVDFFWTNLSRAGRKVAVIDVPKSRIQTPLNGIQIIDWLSHDADFEAFVSSPASLSSQITHRFGPNPMPKCDAVRNAPEQFTRLKELLLRRIRMKRDMSVDLLRSDSWDCFITVFCEAHCAGHHAWHLHDPSHPRHDPAAAKVVGDPIKEVYRAIDESIGELLKCAGPDTVTFVLASHGMGPLYGGTHFLNEILLRLEGGPSSESSPASFAKAVWRLLPKSTRFGLFKGLRKKISANTQKSRFAGRKCFPVPNNDAHGGIRINLTGREPDGRVTSGAPYDAFVNQLTLDLKSLRIEDTQEPAVLDIYRADELYPGENIDRLPDLLVDWNRTRPMRWVTSPKIGKVTGQYEGCRSGDHKPGGLFVARGDSIIAGKLAVPVSIMDFAPTIAEFLGERLSQSDGHSIIAALKAPKSIG